MTTQPTSDVLLRPTPDNPPITRVFKICSAYESGMGHGLQRDGKPNPYEPLSDEWEAYGIGYDQGGNRAARRD